MPLVNGTDAVETGTLQFLSTAGQKMSVSLDGQSGDQFTYSIAARSSRRFRTGGSGSAASTGWIEISPSGSTRTPAAAGVLSAKANNVTVSETSIASGPAANSFRMYAELSGNFSAREARSIQTGVAISNSGSAPVTVSIEATNLDGTLAGPATAISVPARGQTALLLAEIQGLRLSAPFIGVLWVSAPAGIFSFSERHPGTV